MLVRNTGANVAALVISLVFALVTTALLAKGLGVAAFGLLSLVRAIVGNAGLLETLFGAGVTRYVAVFDAHGDVGARDRYVSAGLVVNLAQGIALSGVLLAGALLAFDRVFGGVPASMRGEGRALLSVFFVVFIAQVCSTTLGRAIEGLQRFPAIRISETVMQALLLLALLVCFHVPGWKNVRVVAWVYVFVETIRVFVYAAVLKIYGISLGLRHAFDRKSARDLFEYGRPLFIAKLFTTLGYRGDALIIGVFLSVQAVANYQIANQLWSAALAGLSALTAACLPAMAERHARNTGDLRHLFLRASRYTLTAAVIGATVTLLARDVIVQRWVGADYQAAGTMVMLFMIQIVVSYHQGVSNMVLLGAMTYGPMAKLEAMASVGNLLLSVLLIHWYGAPGVVVAGIIKSAFLVPAYVVKAASTSGISWRAYFRSSVEPVWRIAVVMFVASIAVKYLGAQMGGATLIATSMEVGVILAIASPLVWLMILEPSDRKRLVRAVVV